MFEDPKRARVTNKLKPKKSLGDKNSWHCVYSSCSRWKIIMRHHYFVPGHKCHRSAIHSPTYTEANIVSNKHFFFLVVTVQVLKLIYLNTLKIKNWGKEILSLFLLTWPAPCRGLLAIWMSWSTPWQQPALIPRCCHRPPSEHNLYPEKTSWQEHPDWPGNINTKCGD